MSTYLTTVIKTGNSYALRIPKSLVELNDLKLGEKIEIGNLSKRRQQDHAKIQAILKELQALPATTGSLKSIKDPVAWQRKIRQDRPLNGRD